MADHDLLAHIPAVRVPRTDALLHPIRNHFGLRSFGINAYVARHAGDRVIGKHDHADPDDEKHEELYFVHTGAARFVVDGEVIEAPAGTWVSVADVRSKRSATALEDATTVIVIGAEPGAVYEISAAERDELVEAGMAIRPS
ncbi:MAG: hypothetical protein QOJ47_2302 [Gaiellales bacterium]|nr:hypothetical protein [Gaiellales bacterium]